MNSTSGPSLQARRDQALGAGAPLFYTEPLHIVRGDGVELFDADGRRYIDMYNNVPCVGHGNARVAEAMAAQQATLNVHSRYLHEGIVSFAERLVGLHADGIESAVISCSGTEAVEVALRMARLATGRRGVIATDATYHGNTEAVIALTLAGRRPSEHPEVATIPFPQRFRPIKDGLDDDDLAEAYLEKLAAAIDHLEASGQGVAAIILCPILANEGLPGIPGEFMAKAAQMVRDAGGLVIADEVQAGYCRTGRWWGYEVTGFGPDIAVMGKPMGNGLPLSATVASRKLVEGFRAGTRHFNTFAASPLQAAVGHAVIDEIQERDLATSVSEIGARLKAALADRAEGRPWIGDVRGHGLFIGVEMVVPGEERAPDRARAIEVTDRLKDRGVLASNAGAFANVLKLRPPLVLQHSHADEFLAAFDAVLADLDG
ncbi:aspartate aminotransferase family protein [Candidatus Poriferisodalis sp.]|uniref:aspartate aminotransferase family protein n=1 Tax=Candidatus Poriferisodalis sp. TaxID=3101277 RepID=UPI003B51F55A